MSLPHCPNCRERMSSVEQGMGGVWSCLYCEGTWLTIEQLKSLASVCKPATEAPSKNAKTLQVEAGAQPLACPGCEASSLDAVSMGSASAYHCPQCSGAFFKKGVLAACAPQVFSPTQEAPVVGALFGAIGTVAMLGDPLPLIAALAYQPRAKSAL
ncbi:zf-TFIIB domain-containing protein [Piscinibacter gummiphilus]|uniref:zf-TFIIB domain-containing protein n=1 Tax=Piscinibacter gummiphilus TaxID=946333 RepID=UPI0039B96C47